ncbi:MAG: Crp/Fnr family transcriptional regulator [Candidatus Dormibacteria bacterium]
MARLPQADRARIQDQLIPHFLRFKAVLFEPGQVVDGVHFPLDGVVSLVASMEDGRIVEVATVGNEGVVGVPTVLGGSLRVRAISQVAGRALIMSTSAFVREMTTSPALAGLVQGYVQALFGQISQAAACNRLHSTEERLSRWLLMSRDRIGKDVIPITREFLGDTLGERRTAVTLCTGIMERGGLIRYERGHVEILDRAGLESVSCECYRVLRDELAAVESRTLNEGRTDIRG